MGDAGGPVQLAELGVSLNDSLVDGGGQAEGGVELQEEDAGRRRAAKSSGTARVSKEKQSEIERLSGAEVLVRFPACCPPVRPGVEECSSVAGRNPGWSLCCPLSRYGEGTAAAFQSEEAKS